MNIFFQLFIAIIFIFVMFYLYKCKKDNYTPRIGMSFVPKNNSFKYANIRGNSEENSIAIVTTLPYYQFDVIYRFVKSLDDVKFKGHIILFVSGRLKLNFSNPIIHQLIVSYKFPFYSSDNVEFLIPKNKLEKYIPKKCHWFIIRYYLFSIWLKYYHSKFNYIYFCDGRDVFFQLNPSMWNFGRGVHLALESDKMIIKNSGINMAWTRDFKMGDSFLNQYVINGGTIFGSSREITLYISEMIFMLKYINLTCNNDQGTFIYFYYSHPPFKYPVYLEKQGYGYALSLTDLNCDVFLSDYCNYKILTNESKIKNLDGTIPVIVHGLDRWKNTDKEIRRKEYYDFINKYYPYYTAK